MTITKLGHCCLLIEDQGVRILTDPGAWTEAQNEQKDIDMVLITHEHADHFYLESVKTIIKNNPQAKIVTNSAVGKLLAAENITYTHVEANQTHKHGSVVITGCGSTHAPIYPSVPAVMNTGYMISQRLYYPGDAFFVPQQPVELLALPVCGPWLSIAQAIDFAKQIKPARCFPVHDGMLKIMGPFHALPQRELTKEGIEFTVLLAGETLTI